VRGLHWLSGIAAAGFLTLSAAPANFCEYMALSVMVPLLQQVCI